ncbi:restriction endonuclease subunit S [Alteromonas sp. CyTr2]|uniref:restriction endonuclease subunit S n=1 Tax=Alteromonas sp. CyTr2 TaxID=2935039 RepID=UPI00248E6AD6|nr:restriction endonuclease subunit S [Alteromonas sp. CyTr2]
MSFSQIGDHVELQRGNTYKSALLNAEGPFLLGLGSIQKDGGFKDSNLRTYGGPSAEKMLVYPGDLYVSLKDVTQSGDLLGSVARVPKHIPVGRMTQDTVKLLFKSDIDRNYFYWLLRTPEYRNYCRSRATGTTNLGLSRDDFFAFEVPAFSDTRQRLVNILEHIESKIVTSVRINHTLEAIAQAIFKSWFVDFEPTKAKIAAREALLAENPAATPEQIATAERQAAIQAIAGAGDFIPTQQLETIASLFPNTLVDSELGEIPKGWELCISGELIDVRDGTHDSPKRAESGYPLVTSKHITSGVLKLEDTYLISEEDFEKVNKRSAVKTGDILLTMIGTVGIPYLVLEKEVNFAIKNVGLFRTSNSNKHQFYFYFLLKTQMMQDYLEARMAGTTQRYLSLKVLRNMQFISPPKDSALLSYFNLVVTPIMNLIQQNSQQKYSLAELRDSLLVKLLSGEICFEDKDVD